MKSDRKLVDEFLDRMKLKPAAAPAQPKQQAQRARRAAPLVMRMDGWQISGNVVIVPDAGAGTIDKLLACGAAARQQDS